MQSQKRNRLRLAAALLCIGSTSALSADAPTQNVSQEKATMTQHAKGSFEVELHQQGEPDKAEGSQLGRMSIDKHFSGDLDATSKGEMLTALTDVKASAVYVAIERVTGTLHGRAGSFVLAHQGTMARGDSQLSISVVPDSGSGQLAGLSGQMRINIVEGKHFYEFDYTSAEQ